MPTTTSILEDKGDIALDWSPFGLESIASGCGISGHYYGVAQMIDEALTQHFRQASREKSAPGQSGVTPPPLDRMASSKRESFGAAAQPA